MLSIEDLAPNFTLMSDHGNPVSLNDFRGQKVILYFYPKDHTPGCTQQACDFRDQMGSLQRANTVVLAVSKDSPSTHQKFKAKQGLNFTLLSDSDTAVCQAYGVLNPKSMFGKTFLGIQRSTFLIDEEGKIRAIWRKVKVKDHVQAVSTELNRLNENHLA